MTNQAQKMAVVYPLISMCEIQRLSAEEAVKFLKANHIDDVSERSYFRWKKDYDDSQAKRYMQIARSEYANEFILILDRYQEQIKGYYQSLKEAESPTEAKNIRDSIRSTNRDLIEMYNNVPMVEKIKEGIEMLVKEGIAAGKRNSKES